MYMEDKMCRDEACARYSIPEHIISLFEAWAREEGRPVRYNDNDLELLSLIVTLDEIGFTGKEIMDYLKSDRQLSMLNLRRDTLLRNIHLAELQLEKVDYLRFRLNEERR